MLAYLRKDTKDKRLRECGQFTHAVSFCQRDPVQKKYLCRDFVFGRRDTGVWLIICQNDFLVLQRQGKESSGDRSSTRNRRVW